MLIEYRVRSTRRYFVTRYEEDGRSAGSECLAELDSEADAYRIAHALAKLEISNNQDLEKYMTYPPEEPPPDETDEG